MKKGLVILLLSGLFSGCYYYDGCLYFVIQRFICEDQGKEWPPVALFQKRGHFGHTDSEQRWKDIEACGGFDISIIR